MAIVDPVGVPSTPSGKTFGMPSTFDVAVRPRAGLGIKQDRPKAGGQSLEKGVSYAAPKVQAAKSPYQAGTKVLTAGVHQVMPHKVNY